MIQANYGGHLSPQWNDRVFIGALYRSLCLRLRNTDAHHQRHLGIKGCQCLSKGSRLADEQSTHPQRGDSGSLLLPHSCTAAGETPTASPHLPDTNRDMSRQMTEGKANSFKGVSSQREEPKTKPPAQATQRKTALLDMTQTICTKTISRTFKKNLSQHVRKDCKKIILLELNHSVGK